MKMALQGTTLRIKDADNVQFTVIKSWSKMRWIKKLQELQGTADLELLDRLAGLVRLPPDVELETRRVPPPCGTRPMPHRGRHYEKTKEMAVVNLWRQGTT